jgi:ribosomal protein S18 acetylase RimI-like enzyme
VRAVVRRTWYDAYAAIFERAEMDAVFAGRIQQDAPWGRRRASRLPTLVAEVDGGIVGMAECALLRDGDGELVAFYVLPEHQRRGVGRALWDAALAAFEQHRCPRMWVWTLERSAQAVDWYLRHGCTPAGRETFSLGSHAEPSVGLLLNLHPGV